MKQFITSLKALLVVPVLALAFTAVAPAADTYANTYGKCATVDNSGNGLSLGAGVDCAKGQDQQKDLFGPNGIFKKVTDVLLFIIGAVAVIMLVIGGIRYTVSGGDQNAVTAAKNTILYAVVGIIVAILAYAIIGFVTGSFAAGQTTP